MRLNDWSVKHTRVLMCYEGQMNVMQMFVCAAFSTHLQKKSLRCDVLKPQTHLFRSWHIFQPADHSRSTRVLYLLRFPKRITRPHWTSGGQWHWFGASALLQRDYFDIRQKVKGRVSERPVALVRLVRCGDACMRGWSDWNKEGIMRDVRATVKHMLWIWIVLIYTFSR